MSASAEHDDSPEADTRFRFVRTLLAYLAPWWMLVPLIAYALMHFQEQAQLARVEIREREILETRSTAFEQALTRLDNDIHLIANIVERTIRRQTEASAVRVSLVDHLFDFMSAHRIYFQARLLELDCHEWLRLDRVGDRISLTPRHALQSKAGRRYCTAPQTMPAGAHYLSPVDANIEHGKIEIPLRPTMRAAALVRDGSGQPHAVAVLNADVAPILEAFAESSGNHLSLLDENGFWLHAPDEADAFAFVRDETTRRFDLRHPDVWARMRASAEEAGSVVRPEGLWTYRRVTGGAHPDGGTHPQWYAVSFVTNDRLAAERVPSAGQVAGIAGIALVAVSLFAAALARSRVDVEQAAISLARTNRELAEALEALDASQDELLRQEKLSSLGLLVAGVAHEMNTPLGAATLAVGALQDQLGRLQEAYGRGIRRSEFERFAADQGEGLALAHANLERVNALIRRFKQVAADRASTDRQQFAVDELIDDVLALSGNTLKHAVSDIERDIPVGLIVDGYPGPLGQVVENLVRNAAIHAFPEGSPGTISIRARRTGQSLELRVCDDGHGIAPEIRERIWDPFFTTRRHDGGTGLGLYICHQIVTVMLGGRIEAHTGEHGAGTCMVVTVPLTAPSDAPPAMPTAVAV